MKKWLLGLMTVMAAVSLAACTPTTEKNRESTAQTTAAAETQMVPQTTGGAEDKVPDPNVKPVAVVSIYHKGDGDSIVQEMDSLDTEEMDAQQLVNRLIDYGVLTEGTSVISFEITGEAGTDAQAVLDLNQAVSAEECSDEKFLTELGNTFTENFELERLKLTVNGENYQGSTVTQGDGDYLTYNAEYEDVE